MIPEFIEQLIEHVEKRYYGKYRGVVTDNKDPKKLGRIKAKVPELIGDQETGWALPCLPYGGSKEVGLFIVPEPDSNVWIEFESGDLSHPVWVGTWWGESSGNEVPSEAQKPEPSVKILKTKAGHKIEITDTKGQEKLSIVSKEGDVFDMDSSGITISSDRGRNAIKLGRQGITLSRGINNIKITDSSVTINGMALEVV